MIRTILGLTTAVILTASCATSQTTPTIPGVAANPPAKHASSVLYRLMAKGPKGWKQIKGDEPGNAIVFSHPATDSRVIIVFIQEIEWTPYQAASELSAEYLPEGSRLLQVVMSTDGKRVFQRFISPRMGMDIRGKLAVRRLDIPPDFLVMCLGLWGSENDKAVLPQFDRICDSASMQAQK